MSLKEVIAQRNLNEKLFPEKYGSDYAEENHSYGVNNAEQIVIDAWLESLKPEIMKLQGNRDPLGMNEPYYGAIGGGLTYSFTGTGLGIILVVKEATTGKELNVTAALDWFFFG